MNLLIFPVIKQLLSYRDKESYDPVLLIYSLILV